MNNKMYKKRAGTSGIQGQLYETKLISLIYFRMIHGNSVDQFNLATNRDDVGAFDDICFKAIVKGFNKPITVFIQAKHRENNKLFTFTSETELTKYFDSYLDIRSAYDPKSKDVIFGGKFDDNICFFVMYTTAKDDPNNKIYEGSYADCLNELIGTGGTCTQPSYREEDLDYLCKIVMTKELLTLAEQLAKFICDKSGSEISMNNNDILLRYHVILALNVLDVTEIQPKGHRNARFKKEFFTNKEEFIVLFRGMLCLEVLKKRKSTKTVGEDIKSLLLKFFCDPSDITTLSKLIGSVLTLKKGKLEFVSTSITDGQKRELDKANVPQSAVYEAAELAAKDSILSVQLKVSAFFGNKDLAIRGNSKKIESRLDHLTSKMKEIMKPNYIVTIDESMGKEILQLNGGIGSAVGNILVLDETSSYLKFTDNCESLGKLAKTWYETLNSEIENLHEYKLDVKVENFPKLSFERGEFDMRLARDFYNKLSLNKYQAEQNNAKQILKDDIFTKDITTLAEQLAKFISDTSDKEMSMNDNDTMLRYHVILALNVLDISEIQPEGHRVANFRQDFFTANEEFLVLFKNILCLEILKERKSDETDSQSLLLKFFSEPSETTTLSRLLGSVLAYNNGKLEFVSTLTTDDQKRQLDNAKVSQSAIYEAAELAAKDYLLSLQLKVSAWFGNKDLAIRGNHNEIESRLNQLTSKIKEILKPNYNVTIDESMGDGNLQLNGGIGSAVGNILVFDESTKFLKFTDNCKSCDLAKKWYEVLNNEIKNLHEYRLNVKVKNFPKLSFQRGEYDVSLVRDFYNDLLFYTNQADQKGVENILREEIEDHLSNDDNNLRVRSEVIFLKYHNEIQKLWMAPGMGSYLTKESEIYENAVTNAMSEPLMGVLNIMHDIKNIPYTFNEDAIKRFESHDPIIGTIIGSETFWFTVAKVKQYLGSKDHVVLNLEYIFKLSLKSYDTLCKDLMDVTKNKILIFISNNFQDSSQTSKRLVNIAKVVDSKQIIIIADKISVDSMTKYFTKLSNVLIDASTVFTDLSVESQKQFLATYKTNLQGENVSLNMVVDEESEKLITEDVFNKIINNETIEIGDTTIYKDYEEQFYIDRRVSRIKKQEQNKSDDFKDKLLETFYDLEDDVVVIAAEAGMGKSTLLSHLSRKTKQADPKVWIVRINLADHNRLFVTFNKWRDELKVGNTLDIVKFLCQIALGEDTVVRMISPRKIMKDDVMVELEESSDGTVSIRECRGATSPVFQLNVFLHYYNRGKCIFLFDDIDTIIPEFERNLLTIIELIRSNPRKHKIWITYRSLDDMTSLKTLASSSSSSFASSSTSAPSLLSIFDQPFELENFSLLEQDRYLNKLWKFKIQFENLYTKELQGIEAFVDFMHRDENHHYLRGYVLFLDFLKMESLAAGLDFPYDEYYNRFMGKYEHCESIIQRFPDDTMPWHLTALAKAFDKCFTSLVGRLSAHWNFQPNTRPIWHRPTIH